MEGFDCKFKVKVGRKSFGNFPSPFKIVQKSVLIRKGKRKLLTLKMEERIPLFSKEKVIIIKNQKRTFSASTSFIAHLKVVLEIKFEYYFPMKREQKTRLWE